MPWGDRVQTDFFEILEKAGERLWNVIWTTRLQRGVWTAPAALMAGILCTDYGNPSSLHHKGVQAEEYVRHAREVIAKTLKVTPKEIFFGLRRDGVG